MDYELLEISDDLVSLTFSSRILTNWYKGMKNYEL